MMFAVFPDKYRYIYGEIIRVGGVSAMDLSTTTGRRHFESALLSEVRMLLDYVAADPTLSLADLTIPDPANPANALTSNDILIRLDEIEEAGSHSDKLASGHRSFLQLLRDALVRRTRPASGLTIAYTALVAGNLRGLGSESRATLAAGAYPALVRSASLQRRMQRVFLALAVIVTAGVAWESAKVALGRSLLQSLVGLHAEQATIAQERARLEATLDRTPDGPPSAARLVSDPASGQLDLAAFSLCNRPAALAYYLDRLHPPAVVPPEPDSTTGQHLKVYASSLERDICERDHVLGFSFSLVHADLQQYRANWWSMVGSVFGLVGWFGNLFVRAANWIAPATAAAGDAIKGADDVEFLTAPMLLVWGNYLLPVIFGLLGSLIFVILDVYNKMRASTLHPRDTLLGPIRLVLGLVTGACIGLFFSATEPAMPGNAASLASSLTLSASGLAFLAGFGVEGVFRSLDSMVQRVFSADTGERKDR